MVISIDAELGWGFHDLEFPPMDRIESGRSGWQTLLEVFEANDVPATWAVVGHLFLEECDGVHADHPSIDGWFDHERGVWRDRPDLRFGTDLIRGIIDSPVDHEVAAHSFSHVLFDDPEITREIARAEIEASIDAARSFGIEYDSFVFPRNGVGHRDLLAAYDFSCYRSKESRPKSRLRRTAGKLLSAVDPGRIDLVEPSVDEYGLVDIPPSMFLFGFEGNARRIAETVGTDPIVRQARHGIDRASRSDGVFHMWLHPNNLRADRDVERVRSIVEYAAERRADTRLQIETMAQVATHARDDQKTPAPPSSR